MSTLAPTRRTVTALIAGSAGLCLGLPRAFPATDRLSAELARFADGARIASGRFALDVPPVAESGYSVPLTLREADDGSDPIVRVRLFAPMNPFVRLATIDIGDLGTPLRLTTRIRLARSQTVVALVKTAGGAVHRADAPVEVVVGGCGFDLPLEAPE